MSASSPVHTSYTDNVSYPFRFGQSTQAQSFACSSSGQVEGARGYQSLSLGSVLHHLLKAAFENIFRITDRGNPRQEAALFVQRYYPFTIAALKEAAAEAGISSEKPRSFLTTIERNLENPTEYEMLLGCFMFIKDIGGDMQFDRVIEELLMETADAPLESGLSDTLGMQSIEFFSGTHQDRALFIYRYTHPCIDPTMVEGELVELTKANLLAEETNYRFFKAVTGAFVNTGEEIIQRKKLELEYLQSELERSEKNLAEAQKRADERDSELLAKIVERKADVQIAEAREDQERKAYQDAKLAETNLC